MGFFLFKRRTIKLNKSKKIKLTQKELKNLLHYNPKNGKFIWLPRNINGTNKPDNQFNSSFSGKKCGNIHKINGYLSIKIYGRLYKAHRLAFLYMKGWVPDEIDHNDGKKANNKWKNLREANPSQNISNSKLRCDNKSGYKGVSYYKKLKKYRAYINHSSSGKQMHLGFFKTAKQAYHERCKAAIKYHGDFVRL